MNNNLKFITCLFISSKKFSIIVFDIKNSKKIYFKEITNNDFKLNGINLDLLNFFLEKNIFEIEKYLKDFIKDIYIISETDLFFTVQISVKKKNYGNLIKKETLIRLLNEAKNECKKTIYEKKIIHMLIDNYFVDNKNYPVFPENLNGNHFSIDVRLICLSKNYIKNIEEILKNYQISAKKFISSEYIKSFLSGKDDDFFEMSLKIINGLNINEVQIVPKIQNNKGFFERFFNFFN